ncbi:MAG: hypothetical protein HY851_08425, partial [candidate division Zixibacteria bacterium]|nr:hypothetical protein [candidate division Zixibacteria bacterium]
HAVLDFRHIHDADGSWRELERRLNGAGVANLEEAYRELQVEAILGPYREVMSPAMVQELRSGRSKLPDQVVAKITNFYKAVNQITSATAPVEPLVRKVVASWTMLESFVRENAKTEKMAESGLDRVAFAWMTLVPLGEFPADQGGAPPEHLAVSRADQWLLFKTVREAFEGSGLDADTAYWDSQLVRVLLTHSDLLTPRTAVTLGQSVRRALSDTTIREYLKVHTYDGVLWMSKDRLERMTAALVMTSRMSPETGYPISVDTAAAVRNNARQLLDAAEQAGYRVERIMQMLG